MKSISILLLALASATTLTFDRNSDEIKIHLTMMEERTIFTFEESPNEFVHCTFSKCHCVEMTREGQAHPSVNKNQTFSVQCSESGIELFRNSDKRTPMIYEETASAKIREHAARQLQNANTTVPAYSDSDLTSMVKMDGYFTLKWQLNTDNTTIDIAGILNYPNQWFGLGYNGVMIDMTSVQIINNQVVVTDLWGSTPSADTQQDLTLISATISATSTMARFRRKLNTNDANDTMLVPQGMHTMCYATSQSPTIIKHTQTRCVDVKLANSISIDLSSKSSNGVLLFLSILATLIL